MLAASAANPRPEEADLAAGPPAALRAGLAAQLAEFDRARASLAAAVMLDLQQGWCATAGTLGSGGVKHVPLETTQRFGGLQGVPTLGLVARLVRLSRL